MLEDRLREQIRGILAHGEDPAKVEVLRRASLAHTFGISLPAAALLRDLTVQSDTQQMLLALDGEYLRLEEGILETLHWVRSNHLAKLLHEGYPEMLDTTLSTLKAVPLQSVAAFVSAALGCTDMDLEKLLDGLAAEARRRGITFLVNVLDGAFEAGERRFYEANRSLFDDTYDLIGSDSQLLICDALAPLIRTNAIDEMSKMFPDSRGDNFRKLRQIADRAADNGRGLDLCQALLRRLAADITSEQLRADLGATGRLLDWCYLCDIQLLTWKDVNSSLVGASTALDGVYELVPSVDDTRKDTTPEHLRFRSDVEKNALWSKLVEAYYLPDSFFDYQESWYDLRRTALTFVQRLSEGLKTVLEGKSYDFHAAFDEGALLVRLEELIKFKARPLQTSEDLEKAHKQGPARWANSLQNAYRQLLQFISNREDEQVKRLSVHNFREAAAQLANMHAAFEQFFKVVPDYFDAEALVDAEQKAYARLADVVEFWIENAGQSVSGSVLRYIREQREQEEQRILSQVEIALYLLQDHGIEARTGMGVYTSYPLSAIPILFSVDDPCNDVMEPLGLVLEALLPVHDAVNFFWLFPMHNGARFQEEGYRVSSSTIRALQDGSVGMWESFVPQPPPAEVLALLPSIPYRPSKRVELRKLVIGLHLSLQSILKLDSLLEQLPTQNRYDKLLLLRYRSKLAAMREELAAASAEVRNQLSAALPMFGFALPLQELLGAVEEFHRALSCAAPLAEAVAHDAFFLERVDAAFAEEKKS